MKSKNTDHNTREQLLDAAISLFAEQGIAGTTVAEIAARGGVTSAMIHYYFKTRDQLLNAIAEERIAQAIAFVWDPITESEDDPFVWVKGLVERIVRASDIMPWLPSLWIREIINEGGMLRDRMFRHIPVGKLAKFGTCVAAGQKQGLVNPDINPRLLFMSVIGLTMFQLAVAKIWNRIPVLEGLGKEDIARHAAALLMYGMSNPCLSDKS